MRLPGTMLDLALILMMLAACGARSPRPIEPAEPPEPALAFDITTQAKAKLSPAMEKRWRAGHLHLGTYTPIIIRGEGSISEAQQAQLASAGAKHLWLVTTTPGDAGTLRAKATDGESDAVVAQVPTEQLIAVLALPWVARVDVANSYPAGPQLPPDVRRRISPNLSASLDQLGADGPVTVNGLGKTSVCLDADRRAALEAAGATISSVRSNEPCSYSLFVFTIKLDQLVALASLPWIVKLEGSSPMFPESSDE